MSEVYLSAENVHLPYEQPIQPYHHVVAELACQFMCQNASVLDIGAGVGHTVSQVRKQRADVSITVVDIDPHCLELIQKRTRINNAVKIEKFEDLEQIPTKYDVIIMSHVLEHLERPVDSVRLAISMLNKGGVLILAVPNLVTPPIILSSLRKHHYVNRGHVYAWDRSHWMNFLENIVKVNVVQYSQDYVPLPLIWKISSFHPLLLAMARLFPWLAFSNIAVVREHNH